MIWLPSVPDTIPIQPTDILNLFLSVHIFFYFSLLKNVLRMVNWRSWVDSKRSHVSFCSTYHDQHHRSQTAKDRGGPDSAQILQENSQRQGSKRFGFSLFSFCHIVIFFPVLRERYLRSDVSCGIEGCKSCEKTSLPASGDKTHIAYSDGHFVLPDTNVFLSQACASYQGLLTDLAERIGLDGSPRIPAIHTSHHITSNCNGGSQASFIASV